MTGAGTNTAPVCCGFALENCWPSRAFVCCACVIPQKEHVFSERLRAFRLWSQLNDDAVEGFVERKHIFAAAVFGDTVERPFVYLFNAWWQASSPKAKATFKTYYLRNKALVDGTDTIDEKKSADHIAKQLIERLEERCADHHDPPVPTLSPEDVKRMIMDAHSCCAFSSGLMIKFTQDGTTRWDFPDGKSAVFNRQTNLFEEGRWGRTEMPPFITFEKLNREGLPERDPSEWVDFLNDTTPTETELVGDENTTRRCHCASCVKVAAHLPEIRHTSARLSGILGCLQVLTKVLGGVKNLNGLLDYIVGAIRGELWATKTLIIMFGERSMFKTSTFHWLGMLLSTTLLDANQQHGEWGVGPGNRDHIESLRRTTCTRAVVVIDDARAASLVYQKFKTIEGNKKSGIHPTEFRKIMTEVDLPQMRVITTNAQRPESVFAKVGDPINAKEARENIVVIPAGAGLTEEQRKELWKIGGPLLASATGRGKKVDQLRVRAEMAKLLSRRSARLAAGEERGQLTSLADWQAVHPAPGAPQGGHGAGASGSGAGAAAAADSALRKKFETFMDIQYFVPTTAKTAVDFVKLENVLAGWNIVNPDAKLDLKSFLARVAVPDGKGYRVGKFKFKEIWKKLLTPAGAETSSRNSFNARECVDWHRCARTRPR